MTLQDRITTVLSICSSGNLSPSGTGLELVKTLIKDDINC